jgi:GTP-binding protein
VAVIAHVDHGKTTLVDQLLRSAGSDNRKDRLMDSGALEMERGITITSKVTRILYDGAVINCSDTPGHSAFAGEVDRFLTLSDGFLLVVDAAEGPKSQTKYVLSRALALGLKPVVVFNKCDRPDAIARIDAGDTERKVQNLFEMLQATEAQMDHTTLYASAREGWVTDDPLSALDLADSGLADEAVRKEYGMHNLLQHIIHKIPAPGLRCYLEGVEGGIEHDGTVFATDKFSLAAVTVGNDQYLGRTCTGRIYSGSVGVNDTVSVLKRGATDPIAPSTVSGLFIHQGIDRVPLEGRAYAGDIVTLTGVGDALAVGDTLVKTSNPVLQYIETPPLAPPTLCMDFGANDGPLAGREGTMISSAKIRQRLFQETDNNVTIKVERSPTDPEKTVVYARGELQLEILIEQMRREGFEMIISPPRILTKTCPETGKTLEPFEEVTVDVDSEFAGAVITSLTGDRKVRGAADRFSLRR